MPAAALQQPGVVRRAAAPLAVAAGLTTVAFALALRDPHSVGSWGRCPFLVLTGLPCPFCGGLRAVWDLEHGDLGAAMGSNLLVVLAVPLVVLGLGWWVRQRVRPEPSSANPAHRGLPLALALALGLTLAFGALRWIPALAVLAP